MPLTIATCNTFLCRIFGVDLAPRISRRAELLIGELQLRRPDVVCLQEVWSDRLARRMAAALPGYALLRPLKVPGFKPMGTGLVILTRLAVTGTAYYPICSTGRFKEVLASKGVFLADLQHGGRSLRIVSVHLGMGAPQPERNHHDAFLDQLDALGHVHILCGDLNQAAAPEVQRDGAGHPHSRYLVNELSRRGYRDALVEACGAAADQMVTVESERNRLLARGYHLRLDYIWTRSDDQIQIEALDARLWLDQPVGGTHVSDHYGLLARVSVQHAETTPAARNIGRSAKTG